MKAKLSGIIALVGAGLVAIYTLIALIAILPYISALFSSATLLIMWILLVGGTVVGVIGAIRAFTKKDLTSVVLRGVAVVLLFAVGIIAAFDALMLVGMLVLAASIAVEYLVK